MNVKKAALTAAALTLTFLVLLVIAYLVYPVLEPEKAGQVNQALQEQESFTDDVSSLAMEELLAADSTDTDTAEVAGIPGLRNFLEPVRFDARETEYLRTIDSLETVILEITAGYEEAMAARQKEFSEDVESMTKALMNLDVEELAPIVNRLQMQELLKVYRFASNLQREKLLRALEPEKASGILVRVMS